MKRRRPDGDGERSVSYSRYSSDLQSSEARLLIDVMHEMQATVESTPCLLDALAEKNISGGKYLEETRTTTTDPLLFFPTKRWEGRGESLV